MIHYLIGDATEPVGTGFKVIAHCCNDCGKWGKGFVLSLSKKWKQPELAFRNCSPMKLGTAQIVPVEPDICVANLIGQHGIYPIGNIPPIRYPKLAEAFISMISNPFIAEHRHDMSVHCPRLGAKLAGGQWELIEAILSSFTEAYNVDIYVYDLPKKNS